MPYRRRFEVAAAILTGLGKILFAGIRLPGKKCC